MITTDLHIHTSYCDGRDTPEEMAAEAYKRGFTSLGFSGHSYTPFDTECCMSESDTKKYRAEVEVLKREYSGRMEIFLGLEQDFFSASVTEPYDYTIGSVHYIFKNGEYFPVDLDLQTLNALAEKHFGGDFDLLAEEYFETMARVVEVTDCDIIGHLDLLSKFFEKTGYEPSERYDSVAKRAVAELVKYGKPFEINVGAMTRGYRTSPYPSKKLLCEIARLGGDIVINGDCHDRRWLGRYLDDAAALALECGFDYRMILTSDGWKKEKL